MKTIARICIAAGILALASCENTTQPVTVDEPITISSPEPTAQITKVSLSDTQKDYVKSGNAMAFRLLKQLYGGKNMVCSPLSLQYALAMTANGATGETLQEIIDFLGYGGDGIDALNEYSRTLLEQLPAVDLKVTLKVTDALLVNDQFPLLPSFKKTVEDNYYAAVDNMDFSDAGLVAARINEWASRSTNGFIDKILDANEISEYAVAFLMNALYFKAKWAGTQYEPMFLEDATTSENFNMAGGSPKTVKMMNTAGRYRYAEMDGYKVLALPYENGKFNMYILLPDENDLPGLIDKLQTTSWNDILSGFKQDADVFVKLPKFDIDNKYSLNETLQALGVNRAFKAGSAQFDRMFAPKEQDYNYWIGKVIQKARISVAEWGTEAAAVTVVEMYGETCTAPEDDLKRIYFYADHPFVFAIGETTSGTLLFEGTYTGK
ncbi:MAG: serpin family protein [Bacteroidales bacterium]|nr:serpin family protein [Bacteroidales bacterium]